MKFSKADQVANTVYYLRQADEVRSRDRALINRLFNGDAPYTEDEAADNNISTNINFLHPTRIAHSARSTINNALIKPGNFFAVTLDSGPAHKKASWSRIITKNINRPMKDSMPYTETLRAMGAQTVLHGIGPSNWEKKDAWCPCAVGIDDLFFPSRTRVALDNAEYFAIYRQYTPSKLWRMTHGDKVDEGWNVPYADKLIKKWSEDALANQYIPGVTTPEKLAEMVKADVSILDNDAIPTINVFDFYYFEEKEDKWFRKMIVDYPDASANSNEFLYKPRRPCSERLSSLLHIMFADGANVAPFRYHSVRGVGFLLYAVSHLQNRLICKIHDATFESLLQLFRVTSPEDRERIDKIDLFNMGIVPDGVSFVSPSERMQINSQLVQSVVAMNRQNIAESSAQFQQDVNDGTSKEMTASEVMARMNSANQLVGSMLNMAYTYQKHQYIEICRRFCNKSSTDKDVKRFQEKCKKEGVPSEMIDFDRWEIEPERVLGSGNKTLEIAQAEKLMGIRPLLDPEAQREVLHIFTEAVTDDHKVAERLVPSSKKVVSDAIHDAQLASGALMMGMPMAIKSGVNRVEYIEAMLTSLGAVISRISQGEQSGVVATAQEVFGMQNMISHLGENIELLAQDESMAERVKKYGDALGKFTNLIKAFAQRMQEKMGSEKSGLSAEEQAVIQSKVIMAQSQAKIKESSAIQKLDQKQADFEAKQRRADQQLEYELSRKMKEEQVDIAAKDLSMAAEIQRKGISLEN